MATLTQNKIRIRLKAYDHSAIETAAMRGIYSGTGARGRRTAGIEGDAFGGRFSTRHPT